MIIYTKPGPLFWISTIRVNRDEGLYHLLATKESRIPGEKPYKIGSAACGARVFAFGGAIPDGDISMARWNTCQVCERMAKKIRPRLETKKEVK